ncbi:Topoisomerase 1-associated factor 1 [Wickerhamomyces ciferrii]|uniref:Topoisomerase 1-associated factor 1 n=1 Tax=Wickerhamomyces ciferrii (strain ATCC 14091 / BCRC 22168 / CBS 111 / JCM 3599 / NBRC 0793 / NRRL Y-1031 F-60-10) TaxID=1206466 RepID=K0KRV0_WICCF|nr:Topoisomerase 1-associated factor 1 [Wickerhamomyces ciferrii]CCH44073.1 Topoisomerase 1-associated factor 1 [Wickerhamomyces ciferrii]
MTEVAERPHVPLGFEIDSENSTLAVQIKSFIAVLASALGGLDYSSESATPPYKLGDEAFACLKDILKWIRNYDKDNHTLEVSIACAESGLVINDLIVILCEWEAGTLNKDAPSFVRSLNDKIALACLEILVPLTWELELKEGMYKDELEHYTSLKKHQVNYKKHILSYRNGRTLKAIVKIALPIIAKDKRDRSTRDTGILKLCVLFFRNVLAIEPAPVTKETSKALKPGQIAQNLPLGVNYEDIGLDAVLTAFEDNLVFQFLLTICGSITGEYDASILSFALLEMVYGLTRGVQASHMIDPTTALSERNRVGLSGPAPSSASTATNESTTSLGLSELLSEEKNMNSKRVLQNGSTRHGRFGTLVSLQTPDQGRLTISGQKGLSENQNTIAAFDSRKQWHKSKQFKYDSDDYVIFAPVSLSKQPRNILNKFANDFLDGAFNPLINATARELSSESTPQSRANTSKIHFLLVVAWFLEAERARNGLKTDDIDYGLVTAGLNERTFILLLKYLAESELEKNWPLSHAGMITFKEVLKTVNRMGTSENEDDKDVSLNIKERLFHKNEVLAELTKLPKIAHKHSPNYVNNCVELVHVVISTLEEFSNENMPLFIQHNRKSRKKKNVTEEQRDIDDINSGDEEEINSRGKQMSKERKFNFDSYQRQFVSTESIDTYISYLNRYEDLKESEIKRAIQFLHRVFVTQKNTTMLFRMDFMLLLHTLLSKDGLPRKSHIRKHVSQFLSYFMKKLKKSLESTPSLYIELLFKPLASKETRHFMLHGELYAEKKSIKKSNKYAIIKGQNEMELEKKVSILVAALIDDDMKAHVEWIGEELERIVIDRLETAESDVQQHKDSVDIDGIENFSSEPVQHKDYKITSQNTTFANSLVTNPKIRYLLDLADVDLPSQTDEDCIFKSTSNQMRLSETLTYIKMYLMQAVDFGENKSANDFIKIKKIGGLYQDDFSDIDNDYGNDDYDSDEEVAFEVAGTRKNEGYNDDILDQLEDKIGQADGSSAKGVAKSKNKPGRSVSSRRKRVSDDSDSESEDDRPRRTKKKRRNRGAALPYHDVSGDEEEGARRKAPPKVQEHVSDKYVNDSADESEDEEFFAREERLRKILLKNNGTLGPEQLKEFLSSKTDGADTGDENEQDTSKPKSKETISDSEDDELSETEEPKKKNITSDRFDSDSENEGEKEASKEDDISKSNLADDSDQENDFDPFDLGINEKPSEFTNNTSLSQKSNNDESSRSSDTEKHIETIIIEEDNDSDDMDMLLGDEDDEIDIKSEDEQQDKVDIDEVPAPRRKGKVIFSDDDDE